MTALFNNKLVVTQLDENNFFGSSLEIVGNQDVGACGTCSCCSTCTTSSTSCC